MLESYPEKPGAKIDHMHVFIDNCYIIKNKISLYYLFMLSWGLMIVMHILWTYIIYK